VNPEFSDYFLVSLPERFVLNGFCEGCGKEILFNKHFSVIFDEQRWCSGCQNLQESNYPGRWEIISELHLKMKDQPLLQKTLSDLGVVPMAFLTLKGISTENVRYYNVLLD
jgi:hypothetical protein